MDISLTKKVFEKWNAEYRENVEDFLTQEECDRMEVADLAEQQAIMFHAYMRQIFIPETKG